MIQQPPYGSAIQVSPAEALAAVLGNASAISQTETVALFEAPGRILAREIAAPLSLPRFDNAAVDGYAVGVEQIGQSGVRLRLVGEIAAGDRGEKRLTLPDETLRIMTGAAVPSSIAGIAMHEHCHVEDGYVVLDRPIALGANIRRKGEDIEVGAPMIAAGELLDARHIAILAATGISALAVLRRLRVAVLSMGNELRPLGDQLAPREIADVNRPMLLSLLKQPWIEIADAGILPDDVATVAAALRRIAEENDVIVTSGGAAGSGSDPTAAAIAMARGTVQPLRITQRPGRPVVAGRLASVPILGLPGNTAAAFVNFHLYGRPLLQRCSGMTPKDVAEQLVSTAAPIRHKQGRTEFVPARYIPGDRQSIEPLGKGGSNSLVPLLRADGLLVLEPDTGDVAEGKILRFLPFPAQW